MAKYKNAKQSEHEEQKLFFAWFRLQYPLIPVFAIPNGGHRHVITAKKLKDEGVLAGVPDIFVADGNPGLFIEMKAKKGQVSEHQKSMIKWLNKMGYQVKVCFGFDEAKACVVEYLEVGSYRSN